MSFLLFVTGNLVSGATLFFWDILLLFPYEAAFVWMYVWRRRRLSKDRAAYVLSRYGLAVALILLLLSAYDVDLQKSPQGFSLS